MTVSGCKPAAKPEAVDTTLPDSPTTTTPSGHAVQSVASPNLPATRSLRTHGEYRKPPATDEDVAATIPTPSLPTYRPPVDDGRLKVRGNSGDWVTPDDYPPSALRNNEAGTTGFKLDVDASGRVSNCEVTSSSGFPDLDETACRLLPRRARFTPARDSVGNGVQSSYSSSVRWQIPHD
jgi:protein TonB